MKSDEGGEGGNDITLTEFLSSTGTSAERPEAQVGLSVQDSLAKGSEDKEQTGREKVTE